MSLFPDPSPLRSTSGDRGFATAVGPCPGGVRLRLVGELDLDAVPTLTTGAEALPASGRVQLDLRAVTFLDSAGLRALLALHDDLLDRGCPVDLVGPRPGVLRLLDFAAAHGWLRRPVQYLERPGWALAVQRPASG